jgi:hypothetical protein
MQRVGLIVSYHVLSCVLLFENDSSPYIKAWESDGWFLWPVKDLGTMSTTFVVVMAFTIANVKTVNKSVQ